MDQTNTKQDPPTSGGSASPVPQRPARPALGALGESLAAEYLESRGYRILARNWRDGRNGELDLVVRAGGCTVAVEVKTRSGTGYGNPLEAITARKAARLRRLLLAWAEQERIGAARLRVDAVGITLCAGERPRIDHLEGIG